MSSPETAERLAKRLSDAICGWLTFQQAALRGKVQSEHLLYLPAFEVAEGRGWRTLPQCRVRRIKDSRTNKSGRYHTVDFVFFCSAAKKFRPPEIAVLEIKFVPLRKVNGKKTPIKSGSFSYDAWKICQLTRETLQEEASIAMIKAKPEWNIKRFLIIAGQSNAIPDSLEIGKEDNALRKQARALWDEGHDGKHASNVSNPGVGYLRISPAEVKGDWYTLTLVEQEFWKRITPPRASAPVDRG